MYNSLGEDNNGDDTIYEAIIPRTIRTMSTVMTLHPNNAMIPSTAIDIVQTSNRTVQDEFIPQKITPPQHAIPPSVIVFAPNQKEQLDEKFLRHARNIPSKTVNISNAVVSTPTMTRNETKWGYHNSRTQKDTSAHNLPPQDMQHKPPNLTLQFLAWHSGIFDYIHRHMFNFPPTATLASFSDPCYHTDQHYGEISFGRPPGMSLIFLIEAHDGIPEVSKYDEPHYIIKRANNDSASHIKVALIDDYHEPKISNDFSLHDDPKINLRKIENLNTTANVSQEHEVTRTDTRITLANNENGLINGGITPRKFGTEIEDDQIYAGITPQNIRTEIDDDLIYTGITPPKIGTKITVTTMNSNHAKTNNYPERTSFISDYAGGVFPHHAASVGIIKHFFQFLWDILSWMRVSFFLQNMGRTQLVMFQLIHNMGS